MSDMNTQSNASTTTRRRFQAEVVSDKMDKTIVVQVERVKMHPIYKKRFTRRSKFKVHDERNQYKVGDTVTVEECRPMSKDKRWRVVYTNDQA